MHHRAPAPATLEAPEPGTVLVLAPHPDDEVLGCGGTLCLHARQGDRVHVLVAFAEDPDPITPVDEEASEMRRAEARAGGAELGISAYEFWDYPDGIEPEPVLLQLASRRLATRIAEIAPRTVYAPWIGEHSIDHHVLARAALLALEMAEFDGRSWGYEVWTPLVPTRIVDITPVWEAKRAAIVRHASQLRHGDLVHRTLGLNAQRSSYLSRLARYGEAFAPLTGAAERMRSSA
jgi:LmbE family N-acetylglucosaminyl deacetylase